MLHKLKSACFIRKNPTLNKCVFKCFAKILNSTGNSFATSMVVVPVAKGFSTIISLLSNYLLLLRQNSECLKTLRFFQVIRLCSHYMTFMLMTWKISSIFNTGIWSLCIWDSTKKVNFNDSLYVLSMWNNILGVWYLFSYGDYSIMHRLAIAIILLSSVEM